MSLTMRVQAWRASGGHVEVGGVPIFVRSHAVDGPPGAEGAPLLFLHGFPSSSYDWRALLELLPRSPATCFDFLGFGLSAKPSNRLYSLLEQADLTEAIAARFTGAEPVRLVAHDMGTSVATELLARSIDGRLSFPIDSVLLLNGSMVIERASLTVSQKLLRSRIGPLWARLSHERAFRLQFARLFSPGHPLSDAEAADQWSLLADGGGARILHRLTYYLHERVMYARRWHGALRDWPGRLELAWAGRDPVCTEAVLDAVRELRPGTPLTRWPELGHYPQIEDPVAVSAVIPSR